MDPRSRYFNPKHAVLDTVVLSLLLLGLNWIAARQDPGMVGTNPSPFLLIPMYLGARYGFTMGMGGATLAAMIILGLRAILTQNPMGATLYAHPYLFTALFISGAITGEIQFYFSRRLRRLEVENEHLNQRTRKIASEFKFLRESKDELERAFAVKDNEYSTMDTEIRRLFGLSGGDLYRGLLVILSRQARVSEAAVYAFDRFHDETMLVRQSAIGKPDYLPEEFDPEGLDITHLALKAKSIVRITDVWANRATSEDPHLIAQPLLNAYGQPFGMLLVTGIPFIAMNQRTVRKINTICKWGAQIIDLKLNDQVQYRLVEGLTDKKVFYPDYFKNALQLALQSYQQHSIPSSIVSVRLEGNLPEEEMQELLERAIMPTVRDGDYATHLPIGKPNLHFLLPLTGNRGGSIFLERCLHLAQRNDQIARLLKHSHFGIESFKSMETLWQQLTSDAPPTA